MAAFFKSFTGLVVITFISSAAYSCNAATAEGKQLYAEFTKLLRVPGARPLSLKSNQGIDGREAARRYCFIIKQHETRLKSASDQCNSAGGGQGARSAAALRALRRNRNPQQDSVSIYSWVKGNSQTNDNHVVTSETPMVFNTGLLDEPSNPATIIHKTGQLLFQAPRGYTYTIQDENGTNLTTSQIRAGMEVGKAYKVKRCKDGSCLSYIHKLVRLETDLGTPSYAIMTTMANPIGGGSNENMNEMSSLTWLKELQCWTDDGHQTYGMSQEDIYGSNSWRLGMGIESYQKDLLEALNGSFKPVYSGVLAAFRQSEINTPGANVYQGGPAPETVVYRQAN